MGFFAVPARRSGVIALVLVAAIGRLHLCKLNTCTIGPLESVPGDLSHFRRVARSLVFQRWLNLQVEGRLIAGYWPRRQTLEERLARGADDTCDLHHRHTVVKGFEDELVALGESSLTNALDVLEVIADDGEFREHVGTSLQGHS